MDNGNTKLTQKIPSLKKVIADEREADHKRQLEQLRNEWENACNKLVGIINRNGELVKKGFARQVNQ